MPVLDPKRLLDLLPIAEHGSYTRAAAAQGVSQPALSNSIAALEKALGVRVLDRTRHGATLTDFGRLLATPRRSASIGAGARLRRRGTARSRHRRLAGDRRIADRLRRHRPGCGRALKREAPNVSVPIHELPDDQLLAHLRTGEIDVMVSPTGLLTDPPEIEREVLLHDNFVAIMRPQNPFAKRRNFVWRSCAARNG